MTKVIPRFLSKFEEIVLLYPAKEILCQKKRLPRFGSRFDKLF